MADLRDVEQIIQLLVAFAESVSEKDEFKVRL
jgi:putative aminopeptidase FrvX